MPSGDADTRTPLVFFGHGSPTTILSENESVRAWRTMAASVPKPKAILCVSAHWFTRGVHVTASSAPKTIHDFGPLSPDLFTIQYPAPGAPDLAARVQELLSPQPVGLSEDWGFDHGCWTVMKIAYPDADIPIVQLSLNGEMTPEDHYALAGRLKPLRDEGVMIVGSGNIVHNLGVMEWNETAPPYDWATRFQQTIAASIRSGDHRPAIHYQDVGRDAALAIPHPDHYLPLLYVLGAMDEGEEIEFHTQFIVFKSLDMTSFIARPAGGG